MTCDSVEYDYICKGCDEECQNCDECQKCVEQCNSDGACNSSQAFCLVGGENFSDVAVFNFSPSPTNPSTYMGPGSFNKASWDAIVEHLNSMLLLGTTQNSAPNNDEWNNGYSLSTDAAIAPFTAAEFKRVAYKTGYKVDGTTYSENQINSTIQSEGVIYGSYFTALENGINSLKFNSDACNLCNTSCNATCVVCQVCDTGVVDKCTPGKICASCNACNSDCQICNGSCNNACNSCNDACDSGCDSCNSGNCCDSGLTCSSDDEKDETTPCDGCDNTENCSTCNSCEGCEDCLSCNDCESTEYCSSCDVDCETCDEQNTCSSCDSNCEVDCDTCQGCNIDCNDNCNTCMRCQTTQMSECSVKQVVQSACAALVIETKS